MKKEELMHLIEVYEILGHEQLINFLYEELDKVEKNERNILMYEYMHTTNKDYNSIFYDSHSEQIISNKHSSIIYINKNVFNFENINNMKIVSKKSFEVPKKDVEIILNKAKEMYGNNDTKIKAIQDYNVDLQISNDSGYETFSKKEYELIRKILINPNFKISNNNPIIYGESEIGYAYVLGKNLKF